MDEKFDEDIIIRDAVEEDMEAIAEMTRELANSQNIPHGPKITAEDLRRDGFGTKTRHFRCKMVEIRSSNTKIGFAVFFPTYSTWQGKAMMLQNLLVRENYRRRGVGRILLCHVAQEAVASACSRLDFHVLAWNEARSLYDQIGAENMTESQGVCFYMLRGEAFANFIQTTI